MVIAAAAAAVGVPDDFLVGVDLLLAVVGG